MTYHGYFSPDIYKFMVSNGYGYGTIYRLKDGREVQVTSAFSTLPGVRAQAGLPSDAIYVGPVIKRVRPANASDRFVDPNVSTAVSPWETDTTVKSKPPPLNRLVSIRNIYHICDCAGVKAKKPCHHWCSSKEGLA